MPRRKKTTALLIRDLHPGDRVFANCRDSGGTAQERSVGEQRTEIERYAANRGLLIVGWYIDEAAASGNYARRTQFEAMMEACRRDPVPVEGVLTWDAARWGRDEHDAAWYRIELRRRGIQVVSIVDPIPNSEYLAVLETIRDMKNRHFLDDLGRNVRRGLRANVEQGYAPGGSPPTGYRAQKVEIGLKRDGTSRIVSQWVVDEVKGPLVSLAFRLAAEGRSYQQIDAAVHLFTAKESYVSMFRNRSYLGILKLGAEEFPGKLPALVDQKVWDAVQARVLPRREQARVARRKNSPYLLSGLAVCGGCGHLMDGANDPRPDRADEPSARAYRCRTKDCPVGRVSTFKVDRAARSTVLDNVLTYEHMRQLLASVRAALADPSIQAELAMLTGQIAKVKRNLGLLLDAIEEGSGGAATSERLRQRELDLSQLKQRKADLEQRLQLAEFIVSEDVLERVLEEMRAQVQSPEVPAARRALQTFIETIEVWPDHALTTFRNIDIAAVVAGYSEVPPRGFEPLHQA